MRHIWQSEFENKYYKKEWKERTFFTKKPYKIGTIIEDRDGTFAVYDGAHNWMGTISAKGTSKQNGQVSEYKETFIKSALEFLKEQGKIK